MKNFITTIIVLISIHAFAQTKIRHSYIALEGTYIMLQAADIALTYKAINTGGQELNPAMRWAIDNKTFIPIKAVATASTLLLCRSIYKDRPRSAYICLIAANLIYSAVVINNYQVTVRLKM